MAWKLFGKSKSKEKVEEPEEIVEEIETIQEVEIVKEEEPKSDDEPLAEYNETLETGKITSKQSNVTKPTDQRVWRDVEGIEGKVDNLHITKAQKPVTELDKKVDKLIDKRKTTLESANKRKPSNVIYVVSKPQPGEVRGDWAVRSHGKIFSHHKTKEKAIEEARKIAIERDATVMVQNTDGTFSDGFKPREK